MTRQTPTAHPDVEHSGWWRATVAARVADIARLKLPPCSVMAPMCAPPQLGKGAARERWERSCDRCGVYVPPGTPFETGVVVAAAGPIRCLFSWGLCTRCSELEGHIP